MNWATAERDDTPRRWPRRLAIAGIAITLLVAAAATFLWFFWQRQLSRRLEAIGARGEPVTFAELEAYYPAPPAEQDVTDLWLRAGAALLAAEGSGSARALPYFGMSRDPPSPGQFWAEFEQSRQFLAANAEAMSLLHEAAELGGQARFPGSLNTRTAATSGWLTRVQQMRACGRALMLETDVRAHEGAGRGAAESIRAGTFLAQSLANEPVMSSQLIRVALLGMPVHKLKELLPTAAFADNDLVQLQETLETIDLSGGIARGMIGERVGAIAAFDDPVLMGLNSWSVTLSRPVRGADEALYLDVAAEYIAAAGQPWPELLSAGDAVGARAKTRMNRMYVMTRMMYPLFSHAAAAFARAEIRRRLMIVAIALERCRRDERRPAGELAALVPEYLAKLPDDPTSGQPFRYKAREAEYVVYSPTERFLMASNEHPDAETGADPQFVFRWPPLPEKPAEQGAATDDEAPSP